MTFLSVSEHSKDRLRGALSMMLLGSVAIASSKTFIGSSLFFLLALTLALVGWKEFVMLVQKKGISLYDNLGKLGITIFLLSFFLREKEGFAPSLAPFCLLAIVFLGFLLAMYKRPPSPLVTLSSTFFGIAYIAFPLAALISINYLPGGGRLWLFFLLSVVKMNDVGGYLLGKRYGKHALAFSLSPRKTWEGALGGFLMGLIVGFVFAAIGLGSYEKILTLSVLLGIAAQFGDLAESLLKRDAEIKDSNTLPGLGGVLDITDSLAFSAPLLYIYLS